MLDIFYSKAYHMEDKRHFLDKNIEKRIVITYVTKMLIECVSNKSVVMEAIYILGESCVLC